MLTTRYKYLIITGILILTAAYSIGYKPEAFPHESRLSDIPDRIGNWSKVKDLTISKPVYEVLAPDSLVMREYRDMKGYPLYLTLVYHKNARWGAHNPQVCHKSQGWNIGTTDTRPIKTADFKDFEVKEFLVNKTNQNRIVTYWWFTSGKRQMSSRLEHMLYMCINGLVYGYIESGFVAISVPIVSANNLQTAKNRADDFCRPFLPILDSLIN